MIRVVVRVVKTGVVNAVSNKSEIGLPFKLIDYCRILK